MKPISSDEIQKWRVEIDNSEKFKEEQFGCFIKGKKTKAGNNIDFFDFGLDEATALEYGLDWVMAMFNVVHIICKNVLPTLYYKNPYILSLPKRKSDDDEVSAPYAGQILNYYHKELDLKSANKDTVFNGYVTGMGVSKIGYTTKFGTMPTEKGLEQERKDREKQKERGFLEKLGLRKPKKEEEPVQNPELNEYIRSESPFVTDVSPFRFGIDPRATDIKTANFCYEIITKRLKDVKENSDYKNTKDLEGILMEDLNAEKVPDTQLDDFKLIDIVEIYYKTSEGLNILVIALDGDRTKALKHDEFVYDIDGFPYELLHFNKHPHRLYPFSDIEKIKPLQLRISNTIENILDQVDKYVPKIFVDETAMTPQGKRSLEGGGVGAICWTNKNPNEVVKEQQFTQLKGDLLAFIDKLMEIITLMTGLTKAQMLGMTSAETATEAQIGQAGQNLRMADKFDSVNDFLNKQSRKLWQVIRQFVDLEEISLITGEQMVDPETGMTKYSWMPDIDSTMADKLTKGEYRFEIAVGSQEKPDLAILRKQVENLVNIIGGKGVLEAIAAQGYKIELVEILREYLGLFPDMFKNPGRIIKPIQQPMMPQVPGQVPGQPPQPGGRANFQQFQEAPPNTADIISSIGGEKGQIPIA